MMIDSYKIAVISGQSLNLLVGQDTTFLERFMKGEEKALSEWKALQFAIHLNNMRINMEKEIAEHDVLNTQLDAKIKVKLGKFG